MCWELNGSYLDQRIDPLETDSKRTPIVFIIDRLFDQATV